MRFIPTNWVTTIEDEKHIFLLKARRLFGHHFLVTQFPSLITHNSSLITLNTKAIWHHHSLPISQYFSHYLWVSYLSLVQLFLFLFSSVPQLTKPSEKKKKKNRTDLTSEKNKKKKERKEKKKSRTDRTANPGEKKNRTDRTSEKKKKSQRSKVAVEYCLWVPYVCLITILLLSYELWVMETEISQNVFSVSITHNSKIRELSDENRVIVCQTTFFVMGSTIF